MRNISAYAQVKEMLSRPPIKTENFSGGLFYDKSINIKSVFESARLIYIDPMFIDKMVHFENFKPTKSNYAEPLSMPFNVCFFELIGGATFYSEWRNSVSSEKRYLNSNFIMAQELSPGEYRLFTTEEIPGQLSKPINMYETPDKNANLISNYLHDLLECCLYSKESIFGEEYQHKLKFRTANGQKRTFFINKVVYITQKKNQANIKPSSPGKKIIWSHRWEVRGHWRRVETVGKNRDGEYVVHGFTWVKACIKGEGKLVIKTRIVKGDQWNKEQMNG